MIYLSLVSGFCQIHSNVLLTTPPHEIKVWMDAILFTKCHGGRSERLLTL